MASSVWKAFRMEHGFMHSVTLVTPHVSVLLGRGHVVHLSTYPGLVALQLCNDSFHGGYILDVCPTQ